MKVRVVVTVDVDPDIWAYEYGITRGEVREDVQTLAREMLRESMANLGLGVTVP